MLEIPKILAIVLGVFLSPALPEGKIEVGKTTCQEAGAILQQYSLHLVDTEFLGGSAAVPKAVQNISLIPAPTQRLVAIHTLAYEQTQGEWESGYGPSKRNSYRKEKARPRAGLILCGLFQEREVSEE